MTPTPDLLPALRSFAEVLGAISFAVAALCGVAATAIAIHAHRRVDRTPSGALWLSTAALFFVVVGFVLANAGNVQRWGETAIAVVAGVDAGYVIFVVAVSSAAFAIWITITHLTRRREERHARTR